jgi:tetratricopeptide (TPR) repeat protein
MQTLEPAEQQARSTNIIPFIPEGDFYYTKGIEAYQNGKLEKAMKWLNKAIEMEPTEVIYHLQKSVIFTELGSFHKAIYILDDIIKEHDDNYPECFYMLAYNYSKLGYMHDAEKFANLYLKMEPKGDFHEQAQELLSYVEEEEEDDELWTTEEEDELIMFQESAFYHLEREEWQLALPILEEMMSLFPEHMLAKHEYAKALFFSGDQKQAVRMEEELLLTEHVSVYTHVNLAVFYHEVGNLDQRDEHLRLLRNIFPIHEEQHLRIACAFSMTGSYEEAVDRFLHLDKRRVKGHASYYKWFSLAAQKAGNGSYAEKLWKEGSRRFNHLSKDDFYWLS